jgi:hypothetical protein
MRVNHPIYGKGTITGCAEGTFFYVQFDNDVGLPVKKNTLAVSIKVCLQL